MHRLRILALGLVMAVAACAGETEVEYLGSIVAGDVAGHSFDAEPNPASLPPIADAQVAFLVCAGRCSGDAGGRRIPVDAAGEWGPAVEAFGGFGDHEIRIDVDAPGYAPYRYSAVYETTPDPTGGELYLNITLVAE